MNARIERPKQVSTVIWEFVFFLLGFTVKFREKLWFVPLILIEWKKMDLVFSRMIKLFIFFCLVNYFQPAKVIRLGYTRFSIHSLPLATRPRFAEIRIYNTTQFIFFWVFGKRFFYSLC